jgi:subtilisin family serine protease
MYNFQRNARLTADGLCRIDAADNWIQEYSNLLRDTIEPMLVSQSSDTNSNQVKVAVLDSGLDWTDTYIRGAKSTGRIKGFKNFAGDRENQQKEKSVDDDFGHGTHVTALLLKTSLGADVYIARVASGGKLEDPEHVANVFFLPSEGVPKLTHGRL